jgi:hypothetical protein
MGSERLRLARGAHYFSQAHRPTTRRNAGVGALCLPSPLRQWRTTNSRHYGESVRRRKRAEGEWREEMRRLFDAGRSIEEIAAAAGVRYEVVLAIVRRR